MTESSDGGPRGQPADKSLRASPDEARPLHAPRARAGHAAARDSLHDRAVRGLTLVVLVAVLIGLIRAGMAPLLAWTGPVLEPSQVVENLVLLVLCYGCASLAARRRTAVLLVFSIAAMCNFSVIFGAATLAYLCVFHRVVHARIAHGLKLTFLLVTFAVLGACCNFALAETLLIAHPWILLCGYMFAMNFTFRLFYVLHDARQRPQEIRPLGEFLLYFVFLPYFVIVPYMLAIPRFDSFTKHLRAPSAQSEVLGLQRIAWGIMAIATFAVARELVDLPLFVLEQARLGNWLTVIGLAPLAYPVWPVFAIIGTAYVLAGLLNLLGIDGKLAFDHPLKSASVVEWWRRWNVHFREFLVDLFFYPLMLRWRKRNPYLVIVAGCGAIFLVGSVFFHWIPKQYFAGASLHELHWGTTAENCFFFVFVSLALCAERRALDKARALRASGRLVPAVVSSGVGRGLLRRIAAYYTIFLGVVAIGYLVTYAVNLRPAEQAAEVLSTARQHLADDEPATAAGLASANLAEARAAVRGRPLDVDRRLTLAGLLAVAGEHQQAEAEWRLAVALIDVGTGLRARPPREALLARCAELRIFLEHKREQQQ